MDVNKVLTDLRANVQEALRVSYQPTGDDTAEGTEALLLEIAEDFDNLDAWLQRAGFLPDAWQRDDDDDRVLVTIAGDEWNVLPATADLLHKILSEDRTTS